MNKRDTIAILLAGLILLHLAGMASAAGMFDKVITFVQSLQNAFKMIGGSLCALMFVYGGAKYVYGADDPAGRKQGMSMCIAAIVGGIIIVMADALITSIPIDPIV